MEEVVRKSDKVFLEHRKIASILDVPGIARNIDIQLLFRRIELSAVTSFFFRDFCKRKTIN